LSEAQEAQLSRISRSYTQPFGEVQRAQILLLAHQHPDWQNARIAQEVRCSLDTAKTWRKRWQTQAGLKDAPRAGRSRRHSALVRAQIVALACSRPADHGKVWKRWSGEKLAQVAVEEGIVKAISGGTVRRWLKQDKIKPWRYHPWQHSSDPRFVERAIPVLDLYERAPDLEKQGEAAVCLDEKTSIQARQRLTPTKGAIPNWPVQVEDHYKRQGALQLFAASMVASGVSFARCFANRCFKDFQAFLFSLFASGLFVGLKVVHLILDNGPTHAPKQLAGWIASLSLSFQVQLHWLPTHASWLNQQEIIFSKVQRDVLTPNDFPNTHVLEEDLLTYFDQLNRDPYPIHWTYTQTKLIAKFGPPQPLQLVA
jgi:transposase